ncbi:hypothetical protein DM02DRAFT_671732 [Periconia macrospinosa]|uniref:Actin-like ATPase domain-containing protein n=1 Tax=Periconia macrospinosa TaxID=97972 RepID=A0A2V1DRF5_9PLEO|nr:hypothetical protein DM02DRAFT_671732 [Periconia macrospinosa]
MAPITRNAHVMYGRIDPGSEPESGSELEDTDIEMAMDEDVEHDETTYIMDHDSNTLDSNWETIMNENEEQDEETTMDHDSINKLDSNRLIIAVDFGTTYSSVGYVALPRDVYPQDVGVHQVKCIGNYPNYQPPPGELNFRKDVPTELWYEYEKATTQTPIANGMQYEPNLESDEDEYVSSEDDVSVEEPPEFDESSILNTHEGGKPKKNRKTPSIQHWGFGVQDKLNTNNIPSDEARPLTRFKLLLDDKKSTEKIRGELQSILNALKKNKIIREEKEIFTHYLTHLLRHTKDELWKSDELHDNTTVQFVLCVPAKWPLNGCRVMQTAFEEAVEEAGFGEQARNSAFDLFMISEPEAAAECILAEARAQLYTKENIVVVDAGGGTVDAVTYECSNGDPLRLTSEVVAPNSKTCGASFINERFEEKLTDKLRSEKYLVCNGKTLKSIVQGRTALFENGQKRTFDTNNSRIPLNPIYIDNLRQNEAKHFRPNFLELQRKTMVHIFQDSLDGVTEVVDKQLASAEKANCCVQKVILTGGFGQSPSLRSHLKKHLSGRENIRNGKIEFVAASGLSTTVARGAVLRALDKRLGPSRFTQSSYGFLISEPYEPDLYKEHKETRCRINKVDGEKYVDNTIFWVIQAGQKVKNMQEFSFDVQHKFKLNQKKLICGEQLWMSDNVHPCHYRTTHRKNKGATKIGSLEADVTFLRDEKLIEPEFPSEFSNHAGSKIKHWVVNYEIVLISEGRRFRFEARWPSKAELKPGQEQRILDAKLFGVAASFQPGTA